MEVGYPFPWRNVLSGYFNNYSFGRYNRLDFNFKKRQNKAGELSKWRSCITPPRRREFRRTAGDEIRCLQRLGRMKAALNGYFATLLFWESRTESRGDAEAEKQLVLEESATTWKYFNLSGTLSNSASSCFNQQLKPRSPVQAGKTNWELQHEEWL